MYSRIDENVINNNDDRSQSQWIYSTAGFDPSIKIIGFASKTGDNDYFKYIIGSADRSKFSISLTYSDYSQYQQPFNPKKPVLVRDIFKYTASVLGNNTGLDFISNSQSTSSIFVDNNSLISREPIVFYIEKLMYDFYINVSGFAGTEGDTKLPQQYYYINITKLNGPVGDLLTNGEIGFSKTITADYSKVSDLDGIKIGSEKIEWFRGQNLISTGKDVILLNNYAFEPIYYKFSYTDGRGDNEYVLSDAVKPEVIIDPLNITITQNNQTIILGNDFNYTARKIFIFNGEALISEVDKISDFEISKSYVGSELNLIVAASDGKFYKSTTLKISSINIPALLNGTPLLDVVEAGKEGIYSIILSNQKIVDEDGMSYTTGSFTLNIDGQSPQKLIAREGTWAKDYGIRPLKWLESFYNFQDEHVGKNYEVIFSFLDNLGNSENVVINKGKVLNLNDKPTGLLSITGNATQGQKLKLANSLADEDGLGTFSYQWQSNGISIIGATDSSYTLNQSEVGKTITVVASYTDLHGTAESVTSGPTAFVANINDIAVATSDFATTNEDIAKTGNLAGTDGDGDILTFAKVTNPTNGTVTINSATGAYTYTPNTNFSGSDSFTFKVNDGTVDSSVATVSITVVPVGYDVDVQAHSWRGVALPGVQFQDDSNNWTNKLGALNLPDLEDKDGSLDGLITLSPSLNAPSTAASAGVTLTDVLAALKIYLGKPLPDAYASPYNYIAADFDGNGSVNLTDVLSLLKFYLGKPTQVAPSWVFVDAADISGTGKTASILRSGSDTLPIDVAHTQPHAIDQDFSIDTSIELVGVLRGDVDGSWSAGG